MKKLVFFFLHTKRSGQNIFRINLEEWACSRFSKKVPETLNLKSFYKKFKVMLILLFNFLFNQIKPIILFFFFFSKWIIQWIEREIELRWPISLPKGLYKSKVQSLHYNDSHVSVSATCQTTRHMSRHSPRAVLHRGNKPSMHAHASCPCTIPMHHPHALSSSLFLVFFEKHIDKSVMSPH